MNTKGKEFVVSVADFAFYINGVLACTGVTNLSSSISVSMQEQAVNAGKGNKKVFSYKYGRELTAELEAADWKLEYIALQAGSQISKGLKDSYSLNECVTLVAGKGTIDHTPLTGAKVGVELPNGTFVEVTADGTSIDLTSYGLTTEKVKCTYQYNSISKRITIDAESTPYIGKLVLQADKHNSKKGKVGVVEIVIPSYSLDGNFDISFTPDGVVSTKLSGSALAVEGDACEDGSAVYAYISEIDDDNTDMAVSEIAISAPATTIKTGANMTLSVLGIIGVMYKPTELDPKDCTFSIVDAGNTALTVGAKTGVVSGATASGTATVKAVYNGLEDTIEITVTK